MAKKSQKRHVQFERDHSGCIWGLVSIFDFRHGRTTRKLISDRRHGNRHSATGHMKSRVELLSNLDDKSQQNLKLLEGKETQAAVAGDAKPSMKELMEVEMVGDQQTKTGLHNADIESKGSKSLQEGQKKKHSKRRTKSWSNSSNIETEDLGASETKNSESFRIHISGKQPVNDVDVEIMMEEFCRQIRQNGSRCEDHDLNGERVQLDEAFRKYIDQKVVDNQQTGDENVKELLDVVQILSLDEELFSKLIEDPNWPFMKYVRSWQDNQNGTTNGNSDSLPPSTLSEQMSGNIRKPEGMRNNKQRNFFRRKIKSEERTLLTEKDNVNASKRIVILKPSPTNSQSSEIENSIASPLGSHNADSKSKATSKKTSSYFSLTKFRGKLRSVIGKEQHEMYANSAENRCQSDCQKIGDGKKTHSCDNLGKSSPGKDHFFIERFAKPTTCLRRSDRGSKAKDITNDGGSAGNSARRVSNMYIEAKRHLSEMLSMGEQNAESSNQHVPKSLGRILSLPEYGSSPTNSPKVKMVYEYDMTGADCSGNDKNQIIKEDTECLKEEKEECHPGQALKLDAEIHISAHDQDSELQTEVPASSTKNEPTCDATVETTCPATDETDPEGDIEIQKAISDVLLSDISSLGASCQPESCSTRDDQSLVPSEVQESYEDNQTPSPVSLPPSSPFSNNKAEEKEAASCMQERPSPVSVLDPLFLEDDSSPERTISRRERELPLQPLRIQFEQIPSSPKDQGTRANICEDNESAYEYVSTVLQASDLNLEELSTVSYSQDHILDPSLFEKIEINWFHDDQKLLFDIISEVLLEIYECYFAFSLWVAFVKPGIRPPPNAKNFTNEVWKGVCWHFSQLPQPRTLDQIVRKDMARTESWLDLRCDAEIIGFKMGEIILEELVEETILSCLNECWGEDLALPVGSNEIESSV